MKPRSTSVSSPRLQAVTASNRTGAQGLVDDLVSARRDLLGTRHPTYHRLLGMLTALLSGPDKDDALVASFERVWRSRSFPTFYERPLLILAALRADALQEGTHHPLHAALAVHAPDPSIVTAETVAAALGRDRLGVWSTMTTRRVQTNDTSRAIAWLWPAVLAGCDEGRRPLLLVDVGAGAGLNLIGDQLPHIWTEAGSARSIPCASRVNTVARLGFDQRPLNAQHDDDVQWMRACIWPGDTERLARFEAGVDAMRAGGARATRTSVERLTASLVPARLEALIAPMTPNTLLLVYQTLVSGYLETSERESYRQGMLALIQRQSPGRAMWLELEIDDVRRKFPAVLIAHVRAGNNVKALRLGRMSQHPSEVEVDAGGVTELQRRLSGGELQ